ncbi:hypothetical protein PAXRUDRAFT_9581 [Paxillus rubicundulus Ve08.2h10]|uniref:F-box domain-containing protein n=1 Tax=Paxillus rubicundulus Ve08.2h10 TaxID=930991 RepID=A0A0D0E2V0_9AGAM|nr:hypothetical protein PAXRUDRAFT_9581 [Paxillus rubicundulus Ve08.2h10]
MSQMPPELWLRVFDLATDVHDLLRCDAQVSSDLPRALVKQHEQQLLKHSLHTKRSIVLVCRTWSELAAEFLYQSVLVTRVHDLASLHESLQRHASLPSGRVRLGWWTRRLDVLIEDDHCQASDYALLAKIVRHFSNLVVVTLSMPMLPFNDCWLRQLPTSVVTSLAETCGMSLQLFDCSESILRPCRQVWLLCFLVLELMMIHLREDLMMLLEASRNLRVLRCPICSPTPGDRSARYRQDIPIMSKLESITLTSIFLRDYLPRNKDANHLPALRQLTYDCIPPPFFDHVWKNFVKLTCVNVTTVTLDFCLLGESLQNELDLLAECCVALDKLIIYLRSWLEMKPHLVLPPVSFLGLHSKFVKAPVFHQQALVSALMTLTGSKLKSIRLLHVSASEELRESVPFLPADDLACLISSNIALEDHEGRLLPETFHRVG